MYSRHLNTVSCLCANSASKSFSRRLTITFFFSSRRRHTICYRDWSSDVCSSDLEDRERGLERPALRLHEVEREDEAVPVAVARLEDERQGRVVLGRALLGRRRGAGARRRLRRLPLARARARLLAAGRGDD